ncbi:MAG: hypothetical protein Q9166_007712 [cf. Caloplaca sp. 2 TL-2023]
MSLIIRTQDRTLSWVIRACESVCEVNVTGVLTKNVTNATISWNITTHFDDGRVGQIPGIDNFYRWVNVFQNDSRTWDLQPGPALMNQSFLLVGGWVPEANYSAVFNVTSDEGTWFRLCADWEMKLNGYESDPQNESMAGIFIFPNAHEPLAGQST